MEVRLTEYISFSEDLKRNLNFRYYCDYQYKVKLRGGNKIPTQNFELLRTIGKNSLPYFNGYAKCTASSWVQKLYTYFQLNPMDENEAIRMATLHLEGDGTDMWFHGLRTLGHDIVTTYEEFKRRLANRFDRRDPDM